MEGFVKASKRISLVEMKRYFFYLTFNNRADILTIFNKPNINTEEKVNKMAVAGKINNKNTLSIKNPYSMYYSYRDEIRKEMKLNRVKQLELIMSYSKLLNEFLVYTLGQEYWE